MNQIGAKSEDGAGGDRRRKAIEACRHLNHLLLDICVSDELMDVVEAGANDGRISFTTEALVSFQRLVLSHVVMVLAFVSDGSESFYRWMRNRELRTDRSTVAGKIEWVRDETMACYQITERDMRLRRRSERR